MTNPIIYPNQQYQRYPNHYSGVTINVTNPMMNAYPDGVTSDTHSCNCNHCQPAYIYQYPQQAQVIPQNINNHYVQYPQHQEDQYIGVTRHFQPEVAQLKDQQYLAATRHYQPQVAQLQSNNIEQIPNVENIPADLQQYNQIPSSAYQYSEPQYIQKVQPIGQTQYTQPQLVQTEPTQPQPQAIQAQQAYPAQYYLNNYNILPGGVNNNGENNGSISTVTNSNPEQTKPMSFNTVENTQPIPYQEADVTQLQTTSTHKEYNKPNVGTISPAPVASYQTQAEEEAVDMSVSENIINELDARAAIEKEKEANKEKVEVVALTNEYIMSLENYLNNPNKDIRLMAAKEILTRLNEDKDRYDDAALNALLNKMMQDPDKLVRVAAMSAFSSGLACGNDFTVKLLKDIQENPNASEDDALEAANILLKMSTTTETKYVNSNSQPQIMETEE